MIRLCVITIVAHLLVWPVASAVWADRHETLPPTHITRSNCGEVAALPGGVLMVQPRPWCQELPPTRPLLDAAPIVLKPKKDYGPEYVPWLTLR